MNEKGYSVDDRIYEICTYVTNLYGCLHILKCYTEIKRDECMDDFEIVSNVDILMDKIIADIEALNSCL